MGAGSEFRVMFIVAHPDDADIHAGAMVAKLAQAGARVRIVSLCNGDKGHQSMTSEALAARRYGESRRAAAVFGVEDYAVLPYHDCEIEPTLKMRAEVTRIIRRFAPHVVFRLPGTILAVLSGLGTAALCLGPVVVAGRTLDYHHLFYTVPLFCIGQQLLWFHAFAVRFRRFAGLGGDPPERLPLERWLVVGGLAVFVGVAVFASVLVDWWSSGRAALFAVRRCSLGLVLLLSGALSVMNALMTSMLELHFEAREER